MMTVLFLMALFLLLVLSVDFLPEFWTWQSRIKIGRFTNEKEWKDKVLQKSVT